MTYPGKFFLNLTRNKISLGVIEKNKIQKILDSFDPNEPAASVKLKNLFNLAKALNYKIPEVEINLPDDLLQNETLITDRPISNNEATEIINKRKTNEQNGIIFFSLENIGTRATSITYVKISLINEVRDFVEKAGFFIKQFNIGKFSFKNKNYTFFKKIKYSKAFQHLSFQKFSRPIYSLLALLLISSTILFLYLKEGKNILIEPIIQVDQRAQKLKPENINQDLKINFTNDKVSKGNLSIKIEDFLNEKTLNLELNPENLADLESFHLSKDIYRNSISNIPNLKEVYNQNKAIYSDFRINMNVINQGEISKNINIKLSNISNLKNIIDYEILFKKLFKESNNYQEIKLTRDVKKIISIYEPRIKNANQITNQNLDLNSDNFGERKKQELKNIVDTVNEKKEGFPEFDSALMEYAKKITPYRKPLIIDSIRILSEPTLSSGALVFIKYPIKRPNVFKKLKIVKPSQIKINAKATKSPSIPEKASVGYNSTKRNFIDLERTNLIGIVGKSSDLSALLRLSNGKIIKLKVGQWFEGWRVFAIDRDKIHVENGFKQEILRMPG